MGVCSRTAILKGRPKLYQQSNGAASSALLTLILFGLLFSAPVTGSVQATLIPETKCFLSHS